MTHDERISAYIDNELTQDQEQEFLISLAASDGLRKSFRSELVLKNVLHRDEAVTNPPRKLRTAVFASLGIAAASELGAPKADAAPAHSATMASKGLLKTFFATKMHALVTAAGLSLSALAGYGVHAVVSPTAPQQIAHHTVPQKQVSSAVKPAGESSTASSSNEQSLVSNQSITTQQPVATGSHRTHARVNKASGSSALTSTRSAVDSAPVSDGVAGSGTATIEPPKHSK